MWTIRYNIQQHDSEVQCVHMMQEGGGDYYVSGIHRRNRALDGDVVVLEVLPTDKWLVSFTYICSCHKGLCIYVMCGLLHRTKSVLN